GPGNPAQRWQGGVAASLASLDSRERAFEQRPIDERPDENAVSQLAGSFQHLGPAPSDEDLRRRRGPKAQASVVERERLAFEGEGLVRRPEAAQELDGLAERKSWPIPADAECGKAA